MVFYKINGDEKLGKLESDILKIQVTISQIEKSQEYAKKVIKLLKQHNQAKYDILESFSISCMTYYMKAFNSKGCYTLDKNFLFTDEINGDPNKSLSMREFHNLIREYRNKHFAHSDSLHTLGTIGASVTPENIGVCPFISQRQVIENIPFYQQILKLCEVVMSFLKSKWKEFVDEIISKIKSGQYKITNIESAITPIPSDKSIRQLWGLPERK